MGPTIPYFGKRAPFSESAPRIFFAFVHVFEGFEVSVFLFVLENVSEFIFASLRLSRTLPILDLADVEISASGGTTIESTR